MIYYLWFI